MALTAVCLFAVSCMKKPLSSVCLPDVRTDVDAISLMALLQPHLPDGATVRGSWSSDPAERSVARYRDRVYRITPRPNGGSTCYDFTPPIPLTDEAPGRRASELAWPDRIADLLSMYWFYVLGLVAVILVWRLRSRADVGGQDTPDRDGKPSLPLAVALPDLAFELQQLLEAQGEPALAAQVAELRIVDRCQCQDNFCSTFYVLPKPQGRYGPGHRNVSLTPEEGMLILDVVHEKIACVEVLYRDEIRQKLDSLFA